MTSSKPEATESQFDWCHNLSKDRPALSAAELEQCRNTGHELMMHHPIPYRRVVMIERPRYVSSIFGFGLPWPTTRGRGALLLAVPLIVVPGGAVFFGWLAAMFIEPLLWCLVLPIVWMLLSLAILTLIYQLGRPKGVDRAGQLVRGVRESLITDSSASASA
ncbi:hypothetical protein [uncultured Microbacterium sp.]|uniref:hypothetical protein n=1 Tax=uncultured Microbacterium sp. TaxID=191216 RepID=UPI0026244496|nr:hypothetical protein [uncultured Microbacterium sp.]